MNRILIILLLSVVLMSLFSASVVYSAQQSDVQAAAPVEQEKQLKLPGFSELISNIANSTGISGFVEGNKRSWTDGLGRLLMIVVGFLLLYLGIAKKFEPL
ncbi:MAG: hypothetical protein V3U21_00630, partial [Thermodesulfobacteriota bacterium]